MLDFLNHYIEKTGGGPLGRWLARRYVDSDRRLLRWKKRGIDVLIEGAMLWLVFGALEGYGVITRP